jgi:hypothetical protein
VVNTDLLIHEAWFAAKVDHFIFFFFYNREELGGASQIIKISVYCHDVKIRIFMETKNKCKYLLGLGATLNVGWSS